MKPTPLTPAERAAILEYARRHAVSEARWAEFLAALELDRSTREALG